MAKRGSKKASVTFDYPRKCAKCPQIIERPTWDTKIGAIRPHPVIRPSGAVIIVCSNCKPYRALPAAFTAMWGDVRKNGFPIDADKRPCLLKDAAGFRRVSYVDGEKVIKYVRRKK